MRRKNVNFALSNIFIEVISSLKAKHDAYVWLLHSSNFSNGALKLRYKNLLISAFHVAKITGDIKNALSSRYKKSNSKHSIVNHEYAHCIKNFICRYYFMLTIIVNKWYLTIC